jgi:tRNA (guanine-N7-)-methyltransferase
LGFNLSKHITGAPVGKLLPAGCAGPKSGHFPTAALRCGAPGGGGSCLIAVPLYNFWMSARALEGLRLPWPAPWATIFGREAPLLLEIGFGSGQFLLDLASKRPDANVLGVEIHLPGIRKAEDRLAHTGQTNVRLVRGTAEQTLWALCSPETVHGLVINFPDPWPKAGHHQRRLLNERFLHLAATRLAAGAFFDVATDDADYAAAVAGLLQQSPYFSRRLDVSFVTEDNSRLRTKYELKALAEGRTCTYFYWQRNRVTAAADFPIPQEFNMPHLVLRTMLTLDQIAGLFEPHQAKRGDTSVRFAALYRSAHQKTLLLDSYVNEQPVPQQIALLVRPRGPGELILSVHTLGFPRPTAGVHFALRALAGWLMALDGGARILIHDLQLES